jgi:hypothetical protein
MRRAMRRAMRRTHGSVFFVELLLGILLFLSVMAAVGPTMDSSARAGQLTSARHSLEVSLDRAQETLRLGLSFGGLSTYRAIPEGGLDDLPMEDGITYDNIQCAPVRNVTSSGLEYGPPASFFCRSEPGEIEDGKDNDKDGIVDESRLIRQDATGERVVMGGVTSMTFVKKGDEISCNLSISAKTRTGSLITSGTSLTWRIQNN